MAFAKFYKEFARLGEYLQDFFILAARIAVAFGFVEPAKMKWEAMPAVAAWFAELGIPLPVFFAYLVASVEVAGIVLLVLGLLTRLIAVPLMAVMVAAILLVHLPHGFECADNGFEIPLYYLVFMGLFVAFGAGKYSLDHLLFKEA